VVKIEKYLLALLAVVILLILYHFAQPRLHLAWTHLQQNF
jgi:hypothetical protein